MNVACDSSTSGAPKSREAARAAASGLATLLACMSVFELHLNVEGPGAVGAAGILRYLRVCATYLPRPEHAFSLHADDHLTLPAAQLPASDNPASSGTASAATSVTASTVTTSPVLGDVLVSVLMATTAVLERSASGAVWEAVSAVILQGYERRPLSALAAVAINGVSSTESGGESRRSARQHKRNGVSDKVVAAARALCVASTFVKANAEAVVAGDAVDNEEFFIAAKKDLVAVFPAAVLAVASDDKVCFIKCSNACPPSNSLLCIKTVFYFLSKESYTL